MLCWGQDAVAMQESEGLLNGWRLTLLMKHAFQNPFYSLKISRVYNLDLCTPLSPLTPLVPHPITWSSHLHGLSYCCFFFFLYNQTESNKQLPSSHTLEANFPSSPRCQELFSLEVEPHKPLPHSSWDYWPVWTCAGNHGHREFMSPAPMSGPGDSVSQSSSTFPSSCTEICLRDIYDSPKPLFVPLKGHDWIPFPFPVSPGVCKDTYQGLAKERLAEWYRIFPCMAYTFPFDGPPSGPAAPSSCWKASGIPFTCADSPSHTAPTAERSTGPGEAGIRRET